MDRLPHSFRCLPGQRKGIGMRHGTKRASACKAQQLCSRPRNKWHSPRPPLHCFHVKRGIAWPNTCHLSYTSASLRVRLPPSTLALFFALLCSAGRAIPERACVRARHGMARAGHRRANQAGACRTSTSKEPTSYLPTCVFRSQRRYSYRSGAAALTPAYLATS